MYNKITTFITRVCQNLRTTRTAGTSSPNSHMNISYVKITAVNVVCTTIQSHNENRHLIIWKN